MDYQEKIPVCKLLIYYLDTINFTREVGITLLLGYFHAGLCEAIFTRDTNIVLTERLFFQYLNICLVYP